MKEELTVNGKQTHLLQNEIGRLQKENEDLLNRYFSETSLGRFHIILSKCCPSIPDHKVISDYAVYILLIF